MSMSAVKDVDEGRFVKTYSTKRQAPLITVEQPGAETRDRTRFRKTYSFLRQRPVRVHLVG